MLMLILIASYFRPGMKYFGSTNSSALGDSYFQHSKKSLLVFFFFHFYD